MGINLANGTNYLIEQLDQGKKPWIKLQKEFKYICEESIDPGFIVQITSYHLDTHHTVKFHFVIPQELLPINKKVAKCDWVDKNGNYTLDYFEKNHPNHDWGNGSIKDYFYIGKYDQGWFELLSEKHVKEIMGKDDGLFLKFLEKNYPKSF